MPRGAGEVRILKVLLESDLVMRRDRFDDLKARDLETYIDDLIEEIEDFEKKVETQDEEIGDLTDEVQDLTRELDESRERVRELESLKIGS